MSLVIDFNRFRGKAQVRRATLSCDSSYCKACLSSLFSLDDRQITTSEKIPSYLRAPVCLSLSDGTHLVQIIVFVIHVNGLVIECVIIYCSYDIILAFRVA